MMSMDGNGMDGGDFVDIPYETMQPNESCNIFTLIVQLARRF